MVKSLGILFFLYSLVVGTILFFVPIWDNNMGLYAQIPYEMYMSGNYVIPHLNGVPYIEKPPMLYWFISMSYHAFGVNEFSARLPIFIFMFATIIFIYYMVKQKINEDLAFRASLIFLSSPLLMILNTTILFDIPLMFFVMVSLYYGFEALEKKNKKYLAISYISLAFSVLTKGLVGLALPSIVIFIWAMLKPHRMCTLKFILSPIPVVLFFVIATPWHILAIYQHTDFAFWYFVNEHYYRFLDKRWPDDYASQKEIWVSSLNLIGMVMPWSILCIINVKKVYKDVYKNTFVKFCLLWLTLFLIFFTVSSSTASYYMLIAIPATVVLMVVVLQNTMSRRQLIVAYVITAVLLIVAIYKADLLSSSIYYIAFISIIGLGVVFTKKYTFEKVSISTLFIILTVFAFIPKRLYDDRSSVTIYDTVINMAQNDFAEIVLWQEYEDSLTAFAFLYGKPLVIVDSKSQDLLYAKEKLKVYKEQFPTTQEFLHNSKTKNYIVLARYYSDIKPLLNDGFCVKKKMNLINILSNKNCK